MVLLGSACLPLPPPWQGEGLHTVVFGDSLTYRLENGPGLNSGNQFLTDELDANGYSVSISAMIGADTRDLPSVTPKVPDPGADIMLIALGTNDMQIDAITRATRVPREEAVGHITTTIGEVGAGCNILVTVSETGPLSTFGPAYNDALDVLPDVVIADWAAVVEANPDFVAADGVHLTSAGSDAYRALFHAAIDSCVIVL